eukprot:9901-Chlamydomonas_euryale.AAC.1
MRPAGRRSWEQLADKPPLPWPCWAQQPGTAGGQAPSPLTLPLPNTTLHEPPGVLLAGFAGRGAQQLAHSSSWTSAWNQLQELSSPHHNTRLHLPQLDPAPPRGSPRRSC